MGSLLSTILNGASELMGEEGLPATNGSDGETEGGGEASTESKKETETGTGGGDAESKKETETGSTGGGDAESKKETETGSTGGGDAESKNKNGSTGGGDAESKNKNGSTGGGDAESKNKNRSTAGAASSTVEPMEAKFGVTITQEIAGADGAKVKKEVLIGGSVKGTPRNMAIAAGVVGTVTALYYGWKLQLKEKMASIFHKNSDDES